MSKDIAKTPGFSPSHVAFVTDSSQPVLSHGRDFAAETNSEPHRHPRGQLLWAAEGVLRVTSEDSVWIVPSSHAVWIPSNCFHHVVNETVVRTRNLYIDPSIPVRTQNKNSAMLLLTPLMREIILTLSSGRLANDIAGFNRLGFVAIDEIQRLESTPLDLPAGHDVRLCRLIGYMVRHPDDQYTLPELAKIAGGSLRTIERLFKSETGMSFRQWRSRFRLLGSIELLHQEKSSTTIAHSLGYRSASAFIAAFRQHFNCSPQNYLTNDVLMRGDKPNEILGSD